MYCLKLSLVKKIFHFFIRKLENKNKRKKMFLLLLFLLKKCRLRGPVLNKVVQVANGSPPWNRFLKCTKQKLGSLFYKLLLHNKYVPSFFKDFTIRRRNLEALFNIFPNWVTGLRTPSFDSNGRRFFMYRITYWNNYILRNCIRNLILLRIV